MAQRRPISSHPVFVPALALWFAALFGLAVAVLPTRVLAGLGVGPIAISVAAALVGAGLGWVIARAIQRRSRTDPRPVYDEAEAVFEAPRPEAPARRPLRVREELEPGLGRDDTADDAMAWRDPEAPTAFACEPVAEDSFMILTPQPVHPPQPEPNLDALLAQFDNAIAAFRHEDAHEPPTPPSHRFDPVRAFVARQTGGSASSPLGGTMPDHQAELRAALDKLARAQRDD